MFAVFSDHFPAAALKQGLGLTNSTRLTLIAGINNEGHLPSLIKKRRNYFTEFLTVIDLLLCVALVLHSSPPCGKIRDDFEDRLHSLDVMTPSYQ